MLKKFFKGFRMDFLDTASKWQALGAIVLHVKASANSVEDLLMK